MKRTIALLLSMLLLLGALAACGTEPAAEEPNNQPTDASQAGNGTPANETAPEAYSPDGSVIFEKDGVKVTTAGLDNDPTSYEAEPILWVEIENTGDEDAFLGVTGGSVNGVMTDIYLIDFCLEDGEYYGGSYDFQLTIPADSAGMYALGYSRPDVPGVDLDTLGELELCFTLAEDEFTWPDYTSEPVTVTAGETVEQPDITSLGTVWLESDKLRLVLGEQTYDDWFGPQVYVYVENRTDSFIAVAADTAEADGVSCDYIYYGAAVAPGKLAAGTMSFEGDIRELKGFELLTVAFKLYEAETQDALSSADAFDLGPLTAEYPPQVWGEYENGGLRLEIQPRYNDLITVETPHGDDAPLFTVSETASLEAGGYQGAGWLFSIGVVDEDRLHELMCGDMSGAEVFAKDDSGRYYMFYHPTDVRFERATAEEMESGMEQWSMLNEWAWGVPDRLVEQNGLESVYYSNTAVDICLARAAWQEGVDVVLSTTEYGPVDAADVSGAPYVEFVLQSTFREADPDETPDGEYVVLSFPDEDVRLDFFFAPGGYVRVVSGDWETLYQAGWEDDAVSIAEVMQSWYYAAAGHGEDSVFAG